MRLPEQMRAEDLRRLVDQYEARLGGMRRTQDLYGGLAPTRVLGGTVTASADGMILVEPDLSLSGDIRSTIPIVELSYVWPEYAHQGTLYLRTSPARLIRVNDKWADQVATQQVQTGHTITLNHVVRRLLVRFEVYSQQFAAGPLVAQTAASGTAREYLIPPSANAILGDGLVQYFGGAELPITSGQPILLPRLNAARELVYEEGGVFARFVGEAPALVRIGTAWLTTPPAAL